MSDFLKRLKLSHYFGPSLGRKSKDIGPSKNQFASGLKLLSIRPDLSPLLESAIGHVMWR